MRRFLTISLGLALLIGCGAGGSRRGTAGEGEAGSGGTEGGTGAVGGTTTGGTGGTSGTGGTGGTGGIIDPDGTKTRCTQSTIEEPVLRRLTNVELQSTLAAIFPEIQGSWAGVKPWSDPLSALRFTNDGTLLEVGPSVAQSIFETAEEIAKLMTAAEKLATVLPCATTAPDAACAGQFVDKYGKRLFRRPLTDAERAEFVDYHTSVAARSDFALALKWTLIAMIQAPQTVYRSELGDAQGNLSQHEIATELAYTYNGSTPSDELLGKADRGELNSPEALVAEAKALLASAAGNAAFMHLFGEWAEFERVATQNRPDIPNFAQLRLDMVEETKRFINDVVVTNAGNARALLTANYTFLNPALSTHYGFGAASADFTRSERPADWGIGLLAQGSVLAGSSHAAHTSPVYRGLLVLTKLLCQEKPEVPNVVPPLNEMPGVANTTRERYEKVHEADVTCHNCHTLFDPFGYALEHFDQNGKYRADEAGFPIDSSATAVLDDGELAFDGLTDLATKLAARPEVTDCVSGMMTMYAFGGGAGRSCLAETARAALAEDKYGLAEFYAQIAAEPSFVRRQR